MWTRDPSEPSTWIQFSLFLLTEWSHAVIYSNKDHVSLHQVAGTMHVCVTRPKDEAASVEPDHNSFVFGEFWWQLEKKINCLEPIFV
jgi:hypothetical protein